MQESLVSICCLAYNHEPYIRQCLDGFIIQKTDFPFEVLVHDDASTDKTAEIIREYEALYPEIIKPIYQTENQYSKRIGITNTFQFPRARGKYIAICEGDDYWTDPLKLQKQVDFLEGNEEYGLVGTSMIIFLEKRKTYKKHILKEEDYTFEDFVIANRITTLTSCFRYDLLKKYLDEIKPQSKGWYSGDYPMWMYMSKKMKVKNLSDITAVYRLREESASNTKNIHKKLFIHKYRYSIRKFFLDYFNSPLELRKKADLKSYREAEIHAIKAGDTKYCHEILEYYKQNGYTGLAFFMKTFIKLPIFIDVFYFFERILIKLRLIKYLRF